MSVSPPLCERFCRGGRNSTTNTYPKFWLFFLRHEICGKMTQNFFQWISSRIFFRIFFNEISSERGGQNGVKFFSMKSAVEIFFDFFSIKSAVENFFDFFSMKSAVEFFFQVFFVQNHWRQKHFTPPMPQPTLVIFLSLLYLLSNVIDKSHITFGGAGET